MNEVIAALWFFGVLIGFFVVLGLIPVLLMHAGRRQLARQIAEGTHKVESTTNDFGTLEWRIVEVKGSEE
jgi:hypothetical protein